MWLRCQTELFPYQLLNLLRRKLSNFELINQNLGHYFKRDLESQNKEYLQNDQQAIRDSSVIFVAPYWRNRISFLKVQLAPLAQGVDSEK